MPITSSESIAQDDVSSEQLVKIAKLQLSLRQKDLEYQKGIAALVNFTTAYLLQLSQSNRTTDLGHENLFTPSELALLFVPTLVSIVGTRAALAILKRTENVNRFKYENLSTLSHKEADTYLKELQAAHQSTIFTYINTISCLWAAFLPVFFFKIKSPFDTEATFSMLSSAAGAAFDFGIDLIQQRYKKNLQEAQKKLEELFSEAGVTITLIDNGDFKTSFFIIEKSKFNADNHIPVIHKLNRYFDIKMQKGSQRVAYISAKNVMDNETLIEYKKILHAFLIRLALLKRIDNQLDRLEKKLPANSFFTVRETIVKGEDMLPSKSYDISLALPSKQNDTNALINMIKKVWPTADRSTRNGFILVSLDSLIEVDEKLLKQFIECCNAIYPIKFSYQKQQMNFGMFTKHKTVPVRNSGKRKDMEAAIEPLEEPHAENEEVITWSQGAITSEDNNVYPINGYKDHFVRWSLTPNNFGTEKEYQKLQSTVQKAQINPRSGLIFYKRKLQVKDKEDVVETSIKVKNVGKVNGDSRCYATPLVAETGEILHDVNIVMDNAHREKNKKLFRKK